AELNGVGRRPVLVVPRGAETEPLVTHHVEQRCGAGHDRVKLWPLSKCRPDEKSAVAPTGDSQLLRTRPTLLDQPLRCRMAVVEHVLLALAHARAMPVLAFLGTATQVGDRVDTAGFHPREGGGGVRRRHRGTETAVSVKNC